MPEEITTGAPSSSPPASPAPAASTSPPATTSPPSPASPPASPPAAAARPEYVPEAHWDATAGKVKDDKAFSAFINEHVAFKAADDSRRLTLPASPDAYKVELPADFKPPEGIKFEFKADDPLIAQAKAMAHGMGIGQENFSKLLGLYAGAQVATEQQISQGRNAEIAKLGPTGPAQVTAVTTWLDAMGVPSLKAGMITAAQVADFQKLMTRVQTQGSGAFTGTGREPGPEKMSDEAYERLSYPEKVAYAAAHNRKAA